MCKRAILKALLLILSICSVNGWGPVAHRWFSILAKQPTSGSDVPDGLAGFMSATFSYAPFAKECPSQETLHDPIMSATLWQWALSNPTTPKSYTDFLSSYTAHMIGDLIGFHANGGYLTQNNTQWQFSGGYVNWVLLWPKMQYIDAFLLAERFSNMTLGHLPYFDDKWASRFAADLNQYYNGSYSSSMLKNCANAWIDVQNTLFIYYGRALSARAQYVAPLTFWDNDSSSSFASSILHLDANAACAANAIALYYQSIAIDKMDPKTAYGSLSAIVDQWFSNGKCGK